MPHLAFACILTTLLVVPMLPAQSPVPVYREPRHRLVWEAGPIRVLDVQISPGDTTLFHVHDAPLLAVRVAVSAIDVQVVGEAWSGVGPTDRTHFYAGAIDADTTYSVRSLTHRVTNAGTTSFRLIGVMNSGHGLVRGRRAVRLSLPGAIEHSSSWFQASRLTVPVGASGRWFLAPVPVVIVQPGAGRLRIDRKSGASTLLDAAASWVVLPAGTRFRVRNDGPAPGVLVFVATR